MAVHRPAAVRSRTLRLLDLLVVCWVLAWIGIGVWVAIDIHQLGRLAVSLGTAAKALHQVSNATSAIGHLPLVGGALGRLARSAAATATSASRNAVSARQSVNQLAYLLGVVIVVIPSVPTLAAYLPFRVSRYREVRAIRSAVAGPVDDTHLRRHLATRALVNLPYHQLVALSDDPWQDVREGRLDALAGAELARLGLEPDALERSPGGQDGGGGTADPSLLAPTDREPTR